MHTYLKQKDNQYDIGVWLYHPEGFMQFRSMFTVPTLKQAFTAVNMLNGGTRIATEALHITDEK